MYARGAAMGAESKGLGVNVQLGPVAGPLGKNPDGGRIWEGFSVDPYLSGVAMEETIQGMQNSGVQACAKVCNSFYYVLNDFSDQMNSTGLAMSKNTTETRSALTLAIVRRMSCMSGHS
jgi:beta-glucosidase-like glycosyl hydrolase